MNRRGFIRGILNAAPLLVVGDALSEVLAPAKTIFLPPVGGWAIASGNSLLTPTYVINEALRVLETELRFGLIATQWDRMGGAEGETITIRVPARYRVAA